MTWVNKTNTQQANPAAIILTRPRITVLEEPNGSWIFSRSTVKTIQVAKPKIALIPTRLPHTINEVIFHREENKRDIAHNPIKITPTIRFNAAQINDSNSVINVIAPIASNTRQNITGPSPIYRSIRRSSNGGDTIDITPSAKVAHRVHGRFFEDGGGGGLCRGKDHSLVIIRPWEVVLSISPPNLLVANSVVFRTRRQSMGEGNSALSTRFFTDALGALAVFGSECFGWLLCGWGWVRAPHRKLQLGICLFYEFQGRNIW